jgi:hypothetical protein
MKQTPMSLSIEQLLNTALDHATLDDAVTAERAARGAKEDYSVAFDSMCDTLHSERDRLLKRAKQIQALLGEHFGG